MIIALVIRSYNRTITHDRQNMRIDSETIFNSDDQRYFVAYYTEKSDNMIDELARASSTENVDGNTLVNERLSKKNGQCHGTPFATFMRYYSASEPIVHVVFATEGCKVTDEVRRIRGRRLKLLRPNLLVGFNILLDSFSSDIRGRSIHSRGGNKAIIKIVIITR